jgi:uncharacterized protein (DUF362 family)/NAD-dependent dihydropyrimidine dehydrogenase PreA subunit
LSEEVKKAAWFDHCREYRADKVAAFLERGLTALGLDDSIKTGDRVLLKPNLVTARTPEKAVTTHPEIIRGVAMVLRDCGARLFLGDSPGFGSLERCLERSGIGAVLREMDITPVSFDREEVIHEPDHLVAKRLPLAVAAFAYDRVVNLPKLKTHSMMEITLAVKNLFGFVIGLNKAGWHLRAGHDRRLFARIMIDIHQQVAPAWNLVDGIVGMEGEGPTSGRPRACGLLALGADALQLDYLIEKWVGFSSPSPLSREALELGLLPAEVFSAGGPAATEPLYPRLQPAPGSGSPALPGHRLWRKIFVRRPKITPSRCRRCGVCVEHCPAGAMSLANEKINIRYRDCISCYCCQELCPYGAVKTGYVLGS